jgi:hypothetical protein
MLADKINYNKVLTGVTSIILGILVYLAFRPPENIYFLNNSLRLASFYDFTPSSFTSWGNNLPSFFHVFSLSLLTGSLVLPKWPLQCVACASWLIIDCLFEIFQKFSGNVLIFIPNWFNDYPYLDSFQNYFRYGNYDVFDIAFTLMGSIIAFITLLIFDKHALKGR